MDAGRLVRPLSTLVAGARGFAWTHRPLCYMEKLYLNSSCFFSWVLERSFPVAWDVRGCLSFLFFSVFLFVEWEHAWQLCRGLSPGHSLKLDESPGPSGGAGPAGESHPELPVPQASLSAVGFECSFHHLLSGALTEPKITQSRPGAPLWLPSTFTPAFRKDSSQPELGEAGAPGSCPLGGKGAYT